jgi:hypothetical protein
LNNPQPSPGVSHVFRRAATYSITMSTARRGRLLTKDHINHGKLEFVSCGKDMLFQLPKLPQPQPPFDEN